MTSALFYLCGGGRVLVRRLVVLTAVVLTTQTNAEETPATAARPNVLFIVVDDLNHWVHHLGRNDQVFTPNIDRLAARGVTFAHAYCAAPICNPSRTAVMSGLRPSTSGVYENTEDWRPVIPESNMLTTQFRKQGYVVLGAGKVYHEKLNRRSEWDDYFEQKDSKQPLGPTGPDESVGRIKFGAVDCRDEDMPDYRIASWAIEQLNRRQDKPFFLACGLHKPHLPWYVPRKYFEMYPLDKIKLPPVLSNDLEDIPPEGVKIAKPSETHAAILKAGRWKEAVRGYLAAITFSDMNVGRLLEALDKSAYRENTIVVLWSDHGWHLGEKEHWHKFALWEEATRAPFIWVVPGLTKPGGVCQHAVSFLSIYPTLSELCRLPLPAQVEGKSIRALLAQPDAAWDQPAVMTYLFNNHAVRTDQWRYIHYAGGGEELYDEVKDPFEWKNLAGFPASAAIKSELAAYLPKNNKPAVPKHGKAAPDEPDKD